MVEILFDWLAVIIILVLGVMIKYLKMHWLIAGYNTSKAEDRKVMSEKGIGEHMGNGLFVLAAILALGNLGKYLGYPAAQLVSWALFILATGYIVIRAQRFVPDKSSPDPVSSKKAMVWTIAINVVVFAVIAAMIIGGNRESTVEIEAHQVRISGMYGTRLDLREVTDIRIEDSIPAVKSRTNGYAFGDTLKGNFLLQDLGKGKLFIHSRKGPFVYIMTNQSYVIINYKEQDKTRQLYERLVEPWDKDKD